MTYCDIKKLTAEKREAKWWLEQENKKQGDRWTTLQHNGILFSPEYEPLPPNIMVKYNKKPVKLDSKNSNNSLNITAEEGAVFLAQKMEQDDRLAEKDKKRKKAIDDPVFTTNFWNDWKKVLGPNHIIKDLKGVDFSPVQKYIVERSNNKKSAKKAMSKEEKKEEKEQKDAVKDLYGYAVIDGVKIPIGGYAVQPPGLYIGHGNHPLRGRIKKRIQPTDVIINVSKTNIPKCSINGKPCKWGAVVEDHEVTWIASYRHPLTEELTHIFLKRDESHFVCSSDQEKFEKAKKLGENIEEIRKKYTKDLSSSKSETRQLATAVYLLDVLAIRPGTEKNEEKESDTLGLTTLKCSNIKFDIGNHVTINFSGKSSIEFKKKFKVSSIVYKNLQGSCEEKDKKKELFPNVNATSLNGYLKTLLPDLTAKNFRTWKASSILQEELDENIPDPDTPTYEKKLMYDRANIKVALELNHKKLGGSSDRVEKLKEKISEYKEKKKNAKTPKQKASAQKSIDLNTAKLEEAENNVATSTSKVNYISPQIVVAWCKKAEMPIEKIYNKASLTKFIWAMSTPSTWKF